MKPYNLPTISLFTGMGGIDIGLESSGFDIRVCVERDETRVETLRSNRPKWNIIHCDISQIPTEKILGAAGLDVGEAFMVAGGPPCQPFSKSAYWVSNRTKNISNDPRTRMLDEFIRVVEESRPRTFLLENVCGLSYKTSRCVLNHFLDSMRKLGYDPRHMVLNAVDYGVPQKRRRLFIIGERNGIPLGFPEKTHFSPDEVQTDGKDMWVTAGEAIGHMDDGVRHDGSEIGEKYGRLLPDIPSGDNYLFYTERRGHPDPKFRWRSRSWTFLLKLSPSLPSWTIQANPAMYQGPFHWNNRLLTIDELKALQTIPLEWKVLGDLVEVRGQIGDACPPKLVEAIGKAIVNTLYVNKEYDYRLVAKREIARARSLARKNYDEKNERDPDDARAGVKIN